MWRRAAARSRSLFASVYHDSSLHYFYNQVREVTSRRRAPFITFVLGGPGSGKGTQCARISEAFGFTHLSAGDLLRKEISSASEQGVMIRDTIKEGKIVPSEITVGLIKKAIISNENYRFLIDGFPRCEENRVAFERIIGVEPDIVIVFDCPQDEMGRIDDNIVTIKKRLEVFHELNIPVINYYTARGKVHKINAVGTLNEVFERVQPLFAKLR